MTRICKQHNSVSATTIMAVAALFALPACHETTEVRGRVLIDLNRTTSEVMEVKSILSDSARHFSLSPDKDGVYSFATDTLPTDIYVGTLTSGQVLPMVLATGEPQKICGSAAEWNQLTASDCETKAVIAAERIRRQLQTACDSARAAANASTADGRRIVADSLRTIRLAARTEADKILTQLSDTMLAALPIIGLGGLYDDVADNDMLLGRLTAIAARHPEFAALALRATHLGKVAKLNDIRRKMSAGAAAPDFLFVTGSADSTARADIAGRRIALALLPDSAHTGSRTTALLDALAAEGAKIYTETADNKVDLPTKNTTRGRFARLDARTNLMLFRPVVIVIGKDGKVERLAIDN